jgi:YD repeat-containing protein
MMRRHTSQRFIVLCCKLAALRNGGLLRVAGERLNEFARAGCIALLALLSLNPPVHAQIQYIYDENGRLTGTIAPNGDAAQYSYDAAENITAINRTAAGGVSILEFAPNSGPVGSTVSICGIGLSATPSQNTVRFNGVAGTVTSATITKLTATVPAGATSGTISVTSPNGSATSLRSFTGTTASGAPSITSFTPTIGPAGTPVTINGANFDALTRSTSCSAGDSGPCTVVRLQAMLT